MPPDSSDASQGAIAAEVRALQRLPQSIQAFAADYTEGHVIPLHRHSRAQLLHAESGLMAIEAASTSWLVPPGVALWLPPGMPHEVRAVTAISMRTLYIRSDAAVGLAEHCRAIAVSPLLRELIFRAVTFSPHYAPDSPEGRLMAVILDEIREQPDAPLNLPLPRDRRARRVADALVADPADGRPIEEWASVTGASARTLARIFREQTGLSFGQWRQRRRLLTALERLAAGEAVTVLALDLGYSSPSAFAAMFRRALGHPPSRFLSRHREERGGTRKRQ